MKIGDEVFVRGYVDEIRKDCIIIRNDGGYFGTVPSEAFCYEEDRNGYGTLNEADTPLTDCETCKHYNPHHEAIACERCLDGKYNRYEPQTEGRSE